MKKTFSATAENIRSICIEAESLLKTWLIPDTEISDIVLSLEEALSNIKIHGYRNGSDSGISVEIFHGLSKVFLVTKDSGEKYSIDSFQGPDRSTYIESGIIGGFGLTIIRKLMDSVTLLRNKNENVLWMHKIVHPVRDLRVSSFRDIIKTRTATAFIRDGILKVQITPGCVVELQDAMEQLEAYSRLIDRHPEKRATAMIIDTRGMQMISREAQRYYTDYPKTGVRAVAIIVNSSLTRWVANIFISLSRRERDVRIFTSEQNAADWARRFIKRYHTNSMPVRLEVAN